MPEGPEIRLAADRVAAAIVDRPLEKIFLGIPRLQRFQKTLGGDTITAIDTRGKAMLTRFSGGLTLYSHNQLYGRWYVTDGRMPVTNRSLRVAIYTGDSAAFLYSASDIEILNDEQLAKHRFLQRIGPDILQAGPAEVAARLDNRQFRRRSIGSLYLDQAFIAGAGNYLRSEILHFSRVHYSTKPAQLSTAERRRLGRMTSTIARRSYRTRGVTVPATLAQRLKRGGLRFQQYRFAVFGRDGEPCHTCGTEILRVNVAGRRLYYCPECQPEA